MRFLTIIPLLLLLNPFGGIAQYSSSENKSLPPDSSLFRIIEDDAFKALNNGVTLFTAPFSFGRNEWIYTGAIIGGTAFGSAFDEEIRERIRKRDSGSGFVRTLSDVGEYYGRGILAGGAGGGIYLAGLISGEPWVRETGLMILEALGYSTIITSILKSALGRSRPYLEEGAFRFRGLQFDAAHTALPSGHSTVAFAFSSVLAERIDNPIASIALYSLAGATMLQRMYDDKHWFSDTILGAAIGYTAGKAIAAMHDNARNNGLVTSWRFTPYFSPIANGLGIIVSF